jgi:hypothetical protein
MMNKVFIGLAVLISLLGLVMNESPREILEKADYSIITSSFADQLRSSRN